MADGVESCRAQLIAQSLVARRMTGVCEHGWTRWVRDASVTVLFVSSLALAVHVAGDSHCRCARYGLGESDVRALKVRRAGMLCCFLSFLLHAMQL